MEHPEPEAWVRLLAVCFVERKETNFQVTPSSLCLSVWGYNPL